MLGTRFTSSSWRARARTLLAAALLCGCMTAPNNGTVTTDNSLTTTREFKGLAQVGSDATTTRSAILTYLRDPADPNSWTGLAAAPVSSQATPWNGTTMYPWQLSTTLASRGVPASAWPSGGAITYRTAVPGTDANGNPIFSTAVVFDDDWEKCALAHYNESGLNIGAACASPYGNPANNTNGRVHVLDTTPNPALPASDIRQQPRFLGRSEERMGSMLQGAAYYNRINAGQAAGQERMPASFTLFKTRYGFGTAGDVTTIYYNYADLGLGRRMVCRNFPAPPSTTPGVACWVINYAGAPFGQPFGAYNESLRDTALADAIAKRNDVAVVAMTWDPSFPNEPVVFGAYNGGGADGTPGASYRTTAVGAGVRLDKAVLDNTARLDNTVGNDDIPSNCLVCHGGSSTLDGAGRVQDAVFLPFDLQNFRYSTDPSFTRAAQEESFRQQNVHVLATVPTWRAPLIGLINGWYGGDVKVAGRTLSDAALPVGWRPSDTSKAWESKLYTNLFEPYCQSCHVSQNSVYDFDSAIEFKNLANRIAPITCGTPAGTGGPASAHLMPHAEMTMKHFWESPARAHLLSALELAHGCGDTTPNVAIR